jgi:hypothetical protein
MYGPEDERIYKEIDPEEGFEWTPLPSKLAEKSFPSKTNSNLNSKICKYNEEQVLKEVLDYIKGTYQAHYTSENGIQTLDLIESVGDASAFCRSNILKYASRYDKKGTPKLDILKVIHYGVLLYHFTTQDKENNERGYETF